MNNLLSHITEQVKRKKKQTSQACHVLIIRGAAVHYSRIRTTVSLEHFHICVIKWHDIDSFIQSKSSLWLLLR